MANSTPNIRKTGTHVAKLAFLYGQGDGKPVTDVERLAEIGGVTRATIYNNLPEWKREMEMILSESGDFGISVRLSSETLAEHKATTATLEKIVAEIRAELRELPKMEKFLRDLLDRFQQEAENVLEFQSALAVFNMWVTTCGTRKALQTQLIAAQKAWKENAGIDTAFAVTETREKTMATGKAKLEIERQKAELLAGRDPASAPPAKPGMRDSVFHEAEEVTADDTTFDYPDGM